VVLPRTGAIFGRASKPDSHWLYLSTLAATLGKAELKLMDPISKVVLLEVRTGPGVQTIFPGSVHESDEEIKWSENGEPATIDDDDLLRRAKLLGCLCLFARYWPGEGGRNHAALTVGGFLSRCGYKPPYIKQLVEFVAKASGRDNDPRGRGKDAESAAKAREGGSHAYGYPELKEVFDKPVADKAAEWLEYKGEHAGHEQGTGTRPSAKLSNDIVTEDSAAQQFVELRGDDLKFCHTTDAWFRWNGMFWQKDETRLAFQWARQLARKLSEDQAEAKRYITAKTSFAAGVERFAKGDEKVAVVMGYWDRDLWLLGTPGGTVDLRTGLLRPSAREDGITKVTLVVPSSEGCPRWLEFLEQATGGDKGLIRFMQQFCGYCLTGSTREQALVFVYGPGGNGKSVFINVVTAILNDYCRTSAMETFTASKNDRHPTEIAKLCGARLVTASETEQGRAWAETRIKQLTGGDKISAHFMRQDDFEFTPQFKLMIIGNNKPALQNVDDAARRRFNMVPFIIQPATPDRELEQKLMTEAAGILQWMIDGCIDWQKNGLVRPDSVKAATEAYFSEQDLMGQWLEDCCDVNRTGNPLIWDKSAELFESWSEYARKAGEEPGNKKSFGQMMARRGFEQYRESTARGYKFVRVRPEPLGGFDFNEAKPQPDRRPRF
jgi:putative DNA primase/helicase